MGDSDYYNTLTYDDLDKWFNDVTRDQYQKELKSIKITLDTQHPPGFLKSIQTTYRDPAYANSERVEDVVGDDPIPTHANTYTFLQHATTESFSYRFALIPRELYFSGSTVVSDNFPIASLNLPSPIMMEGTMIIMPRSLETMIHHSLVMESQLLYLITSLV
ncbi:hypothetical protein SAMD00019534_033370 [Acytostelium subglobosum LB1]|uniref:hypothetical protein n=1 Tax=Acytostelium subglobosum LB1 TaxID=1410327 RepID=UPI0006450E72|nr:hypothetical protein SAMD00019534_033370 [Acytostelium subglobosum LB1]GAM20162.1 hypothetical protein SAMD00019534_033370 [Acytostelium subglobosum LB1]|eukprot:XP_012759683.1 hypothetical protein SAMD00019534_033370 [Acytostelium subglobosum LB1]